MTAIVDRLSLKASRTVTHQVYVALLSVNGAVVIPAYLVVILHLIRGMTRHHTLSDAESEASTHVEMNILRMNSNGTAACERASKLNGGLKIDHPPA
ncbi:uncharacterized protein N7484_008071 [Penicillium longicatenatum]|uniref:uncharacterized protein n=1 Tax=Penicillium longicatenatum TaxID=1561947 RepID=UPI002546A4EF|nr:uncharacterized protein N7484_008071 [Penicillium longicatenatum]KAJ5640209.1 hypothetical protein N7484_008071 [Penicillium longicatenatum]